MLSLEKTKDQPEELEISVGTNGITEVGTLSFQLVNIEHCCLRDMVIGGQGGLFIRSADPITKLTNLRKDWMLRFGSHIPYE